MQKKQTMYSYIKKNFVVLILFLAAVLRLGYVFTLEEKWYYFDTVHYDTAAKALLAGRGFGKSLHYYGDYHAYCLEPLYPLFLAGVYKIFGHSFLAVRVIQASLSVLQVWIAFILAKIFSKRAAALVLLFSAFYPFFIYISGLLYVTQIAALLFLFTVFAFIKYSRDNNLLWLIIAGFTFGLSMVTKPILMPAVPFIAVWMLLNGSVPIRERLLHLVVLGIIVIVCLMPWTVRNYLVFHKFAPGRACVSQVRTIEYQKYLIDREVMSKEKTFQAERFAIEIRNVNEKPTLIGFLNDKPFVQYTAVDKIKNFGIGAVGLMCYGGNETSIRTMRVWERMGDSLELILDARKMPFLSFSSDLFIDETGIHLNQSEPGWKIQAVFPNINNVQKLEFEFFPQSNPQDTRRFAFLLGLDALNNYSNGYMIWLQPWLDIDLWMVRNGKPFKSLPMIKAFIGDYKTSIMGFISKYPKKFFFNHFIPEFLQFWSPMLNRITTSVNRPNQIQRIISPLFFMPILFLLPFGLYRMYRLSWTDLFIFLIPIFTISVGYSIFFAEIRFRLPIDSLIIILAMIGADFIWSKKEYRHDK